MTRVLIADSLSKDSTRILEQAGIAVEVKTGQSEAELIAGINRFEGIIVRSATNVTRPIVQAGTRLRVIGRAGVGVDNIDCAAATERGILVMNTPLGNIVSAAEHTTALLLAMARNLPDAAADTRAGNWNRKRYTGIELENKVLGIVGLGKIGQHVSRVCRALGMQVLGCDPYLSEQRAAQIGVTLTTLEPLLKQADFVTIHVPRSASTRDLIDARALALMKPTARLLNVARGGIVDEQALADALTAGTIAAAAIDVFSTEPIRPDNPLLQAPNVILTPHLGASTVEAQQKVAAAIAHQFVAFFQHGEMQNAVNLEVALDPALGAYGRLAEALGALAVQLLASKRVRNVRVSSHGGIPKEETGALAVCCLSGVLSRVTNTPVNLVNAAQIAEDRGIELVEEYSAQSRTYLSLLRVEVQGDADSCAVSGTCFDEHELRIVEIDGIGIDLKPADNILIMRYADRPGMVGKFGTILGRAGINIAGMEVGRTGKGADAVVALTLDDPVPGAVQSALRRSIRPKALHSVSL